MCVCVSDKIINLRTSLHIVTEIGMNIMPLVHTYEVAVTLALLPKCSKHPNSSNHTTNSNKREHLTNFQALRNVYTVQCECTCTYTATLMCS
jgi:hypothetical protein